MEKLPLLVFLGLALLMTTCDNDEDPCDGITCENGGTCADGLCKCSERYQGTNCTKQVTPSIIKITKIVVTRFPATEDDGGGWDLTDGPDIYPYLFTGSTEIYDSPTVFNNANPSVDYEFVPTTPIEINALKTYTLSLMDYDDELTPDDLMDGVIFTPYDNENGFPGKLILEPTGGKVFFTLHVTYVF